MQVYKVALNDAGRTAFSARRLSSAPTDSHIVRLIDGPIEIGDRTVLVLEQAGEQTLGPVPPPRGPADHRRAGEPRRPPVPGGRLPGR